MLKEPEEIWAGDIAAATADTYVFVTNDAAERVILTDDADALFVVINHGSEDADEPPVGGSHWIPMALFNALDSSGCTHHRKPDNDLGLLPGVSHRLFHPP